MVNTILNLPFGIYVYRPVVAMFGIVSHFASHTKCGNVLLARLTKGQLGTAPSISPKTQTSAAVYRAKKRTKKNTHFDGGVTNQWCFMVLIGKNEKNNCYQQNDGGVTYQSLKNGALPISKTLRDSLKTLPENLPWGVELSEPRFRPLAVLGILLEGTHTSSGSCTMHIYKYIYNV